MFPRFALFLALAGCAALSQPAAPSTDPATAAVSVNTTLATAAEHANTDDEAALQAWRAAYDQFERDLEPLLRIHCGQRRTAALEYDFARVRKALHRSAAAVETVVALQSGIDHCVATIPTGP